MADKPVTTASWGAAKNAVGDRMAYFSMWFSHARSLQLETADGQDFTQGFGQTSVAHEISEERIALAHGSNGREVWLLEEKSARLFLLREIREVHHLSLRPLATILIEMDLNGLVETQRQNMHWLNSPLSCAIYSGDVCLYSSDERVRGLEVGVAGGAALGVAAELPHDVAELVLERTAPQLAHICSKRSGI